MFVPVRAAIDAENMNCSLVEKLLFCSFVGRKKILRTNVHAQLWAGGMLIDQISPFGLATLFFLTIKFIRPENVNYSQKNQ